MNSVTHVPDRYKLTEVGVIPEDWGVALLGDNAIKVGSGITPKGGSTVYKESGRSFMRSQNVGWGVLKLNDIAFINEETHASFPTSEIKKDDVLLNITGASIGRCALATSVIAGGNVNQHVCIIRTKNKVLDATYLCRVLLSDIGQGQIDSFQAGGNREGLNFAQIKSFNIPLPPTKTEQTAIANALSDADAWIQSLTRLIAKKHQIKQGAMQDLLSPWEKVNNGEVKIESGEFKTAKPCSQLSTLNSQLKKGWVVKTLGDVADVIGGGTPSSFNSSFWNGDINWYTPTEIGENKYVYESKRKITAEGYSNSSANFLPIGTILLTSRAGIGDLGILMKEGCTNQGFQSLIAKESTGYEFLYYLMGTLKNQLLQNASGSTFLEISPGKLKQIEVVVPQKEEQENIATILSDMDKEITALETKLKKAQQIKQGMMQELLTGKTRLIKLKMED